MVGRRCRRVSLVFHLYLPSFSFLGFLAENLTDITLSCFITFRSSVSVAPPAYDDTADTRTCRSLPMPVPQPLEQVQDQLHGWSSSSSSVSVPPSQSRLVENIRYALTYNIVNASYVLTNDTVSLYAYCHVVQLRSSPFRRLHRQEN